ncbi:hypothetical protein SB816_06590 [Achromobacter sp. SIMBA_011]|uniref:hypothetical protein n=1 Tax=Achromobacter sp. SIMBA_011 TaxID=3085759 RepID=UPI00397C8039
MRDPVSAWPARKETLFLRFQPVFTAQGRVHEYAVADGFTPWSGGADNLAPQRARLRAAAAFAEQSGALIDLSFEHALAGPGDADLAQRLCTDLDMGLTRDQLCLGARAGGKRAHLATRRLTFLLPLFQRLLPQASVLASYAEFQPGLRAQLLPATCGGEPVACGALRVCGLTLKIPRGLGADRSLQQRFCAVMACIEDAKLQVLADDIEDIHDFVWLRAHPGLLFRGAMLSAPLSAQCLAVWLQADGGAWRSFNACVHRPGPGAG